MSWTEPRIFALFGPVTKNALSFPSSGPELMNVVVAKAGAAKAKQRSVSVRAATRIFKV
jgi:hypothetical protein